MSCDEDRLEEIAIVRESMEEMEMRIKDLEYELRILSRNIGKMLHEYEQKHGQET